MEDKPFLDLKKVLNDSKKNYIEKIKAIIAGWKTVYTSLINGQPCEELKQYLFKSTLQYVLQGDCTQLEEALKVALTIELHKLMAYPKTDQEALKRFGLLIKLIYDPWSNSTLHKILHSLSPTDNEVREYISLEGCELLLMRLEVLCEGKCEDLAFKLSSTILKHLYENKDFSRQDVNSISDVLLMLLFKFKRNQEIIEKLKNLDLVDGLSLVKRFGIKKSNSCSGLWKFCDKVTELAAHTVLASVIVQNIESEEKQSLFYELVNEWALIHIPKLSQCISTLCDMVRKIVQNAGSPINVYVFAQVLHKQLGDQVKPLCIELYIRGFTSSINLIEHFKSSNNIGETTKAEILLSNSFLELSELLEDNIIIHRECVLTSFSLHPTKGCLNRLENAASLRCKNCKNEETLPKAESDKLNIWNNCDNISCVHAREKTEDNFIEAVNSLNILNSDLLGLAPHLCDDLSTVLCSPRCQTLSWSLGWSRLKTQCEKYLDEHCERKTRNTELKYLNIDYTQFKKETKRTKQSTPKKVSPKKQQKPAKVEEQLVEVKKSALSPVRRITPLRDYSNSHRKVPNKNPPWLKTNNTVNTNYGVNSISEETNDAFDVNGKRLFPTNTDDISLSLFSDPCSLKSQIKSTSISYAPCYFECNEGSVLSISDDSFEDVSTRSPNLAEVPPVTLTTSSFHEHLAPLLNSVTTRKTYVTDIISNSDKNSSPLEHRVKTDFGDRLKRINILSKTPLKNDKLFAKYIPGMNSLDLIVPLRQEPTVQVVQIPSSNAILQPVSSNSPSTIQTNSTTISIAKPLTESISTQSTAIVSTHSQTQHTQAVESSHEVANNSNLLLTTVVNQGGLSRIHNSDQRNTLLAAAISSNRSQNKTSESSTSESVNITMEPVNSLVNVSSHEGSTQVTAHIQRVGQPHKQKLIFNETNSLKSTPQNTNVHLSGIQVFEESAKQSQSTSVTSSVYRFILKDGKIIEQYCHSNQSSAFTLPEVLNENVLQTVSQQDNVIKLYKKSNEPKKDESTNSESVQVPSLPQFHQAFRRQIYQSGSMIEGNSLATSPSPRQYSDESIESQKQECISSPLSKAVQTVLKDAETSTKISDNLSEDALTASSSSSAQEIKEDVQGSDVSPPGVIFTCKVPITLSGNNVLQTKPANVLKTTNSQDMLAKTQKNDTEPKVKDSVIRNNMNALLAAALQSSPVKSTPAEASNPSIIHCMKQVKVGGVQETKIDAPNLGTNKLRMPSPTQKNIRRPPLVQPTNSSRFTRPISHSSTSTGTTTNQTSPPVVSMPLPTRTVQGLSTNQNSLTNLSKVDNRREQLSQSTEPSSVSSTTLEQLREFESVLEQVTNTSQMKERGNAKKAETLVPTTSPGSEYSNSNSPKVNTLFQSSLVNAISDLSNDNRVSLTFISKASTTCTNTIISGTSPKITANTPVVVVQSCNRPLASPSSLSMTSQNSPGSSPSTPPSNSQSKISPKLPKPKAKSIGGKTTPTTTIKVSTIPKPQQKPQEDEQTTQRIYAILDKYAEQLRNSPELKNKPAPRRRSNPPTNPSQSSKRKKSSQNKSKSFTNIPSCSGIEMSPNSEDLRTGGSEDSSNGVSQVTQTVNSPHSRSEEHSNQGDTSSDIGESMDKDRLQHRILLTDQSGGSGRTVIVQDNVNPVISVEGTKVIAGKQLVVGGNATVPLTLQLPGTGNVKQVLFPVPADGRPIVVAKVPKMYRFHQVTMPSGSPLIATNSTGTVLLRQMCLNKSSSTLKQVKLPVVSQISTHMTSHPTVVLPSGSPSFTLSTGSSIDGESLGIALDNTILLNSSSGQTSSIGFVQRNVSKSSQSSNVLTQTRQMTSQETNTGSPGSEMLSSIKTEDTVIKCEGDTSMSSDQCDVEIKSEDVKYSLDGSTSLNASHKGASLIGSSTNNNWVQVLKSNNPGSNIEDEEVNSPIRVALEKGICIREYKEERDIAITGQQNTLSQTQGLKRKVENTIFQIAFKRDKTKISKDDFIQQRNTCAIERELRLQKSLSEECEDLGVDKPSTSDLFPEAELLLDPDPLSRDSLQAESFPRGDSSSSSYSSPNHSPIFSNKSTNAWKKQKRPVVRHKFTYARCVNTIKKNVADKTDSLQECSTFNVNLSPSKNVQYQEKDSDGNSKCIPKDPESVNDGDHTIIQGSDIIMECNDSDPCNFSDVEGNNDTDMLDTEGDSDNEFLQKPRVCKGSCNSLMKKDTDPEKSSGPSILRRLSGSPFNRSDFYSNKDSSEEKNSDHSPWYQMMKGIHKDGNDSETERCDLGCREDINESQNGDLEDFDEHQGTNNYISNKTLQAPKEKKIGLFMGSQSEDSASSIDTLLTGSDICSADFQESLRKRASPRGRVKKGCPCLNGSPEPNKKKKDLPFLDKTEKPCSTKTSFTFGNKKSVSKSNVKLINRKR